MKLSSSLPVHLLLFILSSLDEDCRAEPAPRLVYAGNVLSYIPSSAHVYRMSPASNWTRRAVEGEGEEEDVICHPAGACEPCPVDLLEEPFCQPFGNRRLLHCLAVSSSASDDRPSTETSLDGQEPEGNDTGGAPHSPPSHHPASRPPPSALPAWESCGRRVPKERADFFEFVLSNVIFSALALTGVLIRSERMRVVRARRLAARIGVGLRRASSGSWAAMGGMSAALVGVNARSAEEEDLMRGDASGS